jgi:ankyrin repeat protein
MQAAKIRPAIVLSIALAVAVIPARHAAAAGPDMRLADMARSHDVAGIKSLIAQKADPNAPGEDGTPALHWIVRVDDLATTQFLLRSGADATQANRYGLRPLSIAAANGNAAIITALVEAGADPNAADPAGETPLMAAARVGSVEAAKALLDRGATIDAADPAFHQTALIVAVRDNRPDVVQLLIAHHADVNAKTRVGITPPFILPNSVPGFGHGIGIVRGGSPDRGRRSPRPGGMSPLHYAARDGRLDIAQALVAAGADVNAREANDITPLLTAISNNHVDVAQFLIDHGADVNASDWYGRTPLWSAVETRNMDVDNASFENGIDRAPFLALITTLLDHGANPNARTAEQPPVRPSFLRVTGTLEWVNFTGMTPFIYAARAGDVTVMRALLAHGADPNITTFGGTTALMAASGVNWVFSQTYDEGQKALLDAVQLCFDLGQDVNATNSMGITALIGAANRGSDDIIRFLVSKGAKLDAKDKEGRTAMTWAEGVFLATIPPKAKPSSIALLKELAGGSQAAQQ